MHPLELFRDTPWPTLVGIAACVLLLGMSKGGFPIQSISLPFLILIWPDQMEPARKSVSFLLPLLCAMDIVAMAFYWRHVQWDRIRYAAPGALAGVAIASLLFFSKSESLLTISDRALQICVGLLGLSFVVYQATRHRILSRIGGGEALVPGWKIGTIAGLGCGITSTIAHAAGPVSQMYFLPQKLPKMQLAGTLCGFFFALNAVKLIPFGLQGRLTADTLSMGALMLPVVPVGVGMGYALVRLLKEKYYILFIYTLLAVTSVSLLWKALAA
jgi:uncharacterized membrane protein YfcA